MLELNTLYPDCAPGRAHAFTTSRSLLGKTVYCTGCGMTPKQLINIRREWDKAGISKEGKWK